MIQEVHNPVYQAGSEARAGIRAGLNNFPLAAVILGGAEAITGCDYVSGTHVSAGGRVWSGVLAVMSIIPGGRGRGAGAEARGVLAGATRGSKATLYRAVSTAELKDILSNGGFRVGDGMNGKWFATSAEDAAAWGRKFYHLYEFEDYRDYDCYIRRRPADRNMFDFRCYVLGMDAAVQSRV